MKSRSRTGETTSEGRGRGGRHSINGQNLTPIGNTQDECKIIYFYLFIYLFIYLLFIYFSQLITDAYKDLMHSMEENSQTAIGESIMLSARAIEEFAFKYASFNLNASKREARKKNQRIGTKYTFESFLSFVF